MDQWSSRLVLIIHENPAFSAALSGCLEDVGWLARSMRSIEAAMSWIALEPHHYPIAIVVALHDDDSGANAAVFNIREGFPTGVILALVAKVEHERNTCLLLRGVLPLKTPIAPEVLVGLIVGADFKSGVAAAEMAPASDAFTRRWSARDSEPPVSSVFGPARSACNLDTALERYASQQRFSSQQLRVLKLHLEGKHDKEIASIMGRAQTTVYEHWRRMSEKASVRYKSGLLADFHRFLRENASFDGNQSQPPQPAVARAAKTGKLGRERE